MNGIEQQTAGSHVISWYKNKSNQSEIQSNRAQFLRRLTTLTSVLQDKALRFTFCPHCPWLAPTVFMHSNKVVQANLWEQIMQEHEHERHWTTNCRQPCHLFYKNKSNQSEIQSNRAQFLRRLTTLTSVLQDKALRFTFRPHCPLAPTVFMHSNKVVQANLWEHLVQEHEHERHWTTNCRQPCHLLVQKQEQSKWNSVEQSSVPQKVNYPHKRTSGQSIAIYILSSLPMIGPHSFHALQQSGASKLVRADHARAWTWTALNNKLQAAMSSLLQKQEQSKWNSVEQSSVPQKVNYPHKRTSGQSIAIYISSSLPIGPHSFHALQQSGASELVRASRARAWTWTALNNKLQAAMSSLGTKTRAIKVKFSRTELSSSEG